VAKVESNAGAAALRLPPPSGAGGPPVPLAANLATLRARYHRMRTAYGWCGVTGRRRLVAAAGLAAAVLVAAFLLWLDAAAVDWADALTRRARRIVQGVTRLGRSDWLLVPSGVLALVLLAGNWRRAGRRAAAAWVGIGHLAGFVFAAVALSGMVGNVVKAGLGRSRPILFESDGTLALAPLSFGYASLSFPSGHAITVAAAATAVALVWRGRPWVALAAGAFAIAVAASRVLVRAHYPSDVVAGLFIGFAVTFLLAQVFGRRGVAFRHDRDGRLVAKTAAIRRAFATRAGRRAACAGLIAAYLPAGSRQRRAGVATA
jgi:membrane-associated phospholipid phosphatase